MASVSCEYVVKKVNVEGTIESKDHRLSAVFEL